MMGLFETPAISETEIFCFAGAQSASLRQQLFSNFDIAFRQ